MRPYLNCDLDSKALRLSSTICPDYLFGTLSSLVTTGNVKDLVRREPQISPRLQICNLQTTHVSHTLLGQWEEPGGAVGSAERASPEELSASSWQEETFPAAVGTASQRKQLHLFIQQAGLQQLGWEFPPFIPTKTVHVNLCQMLHSDAMQLLRCFAVRTTCVVFFFNNINLISEMQRIKCKQQILTTFQTPPPTPTCFIF